MDVTVYFDFGSPYAYLAWQRIRQHPERYEAAKVTWVPVSAGHIFKMDGTAPNMTMPNQARYLQEDVKRWAERMGVPFAPPAQGRPGQMPVNSLAAMRLHVAAEEAGLAEAWREAVYLAYFEHGRDISDAAVLAELASDVGLDADPTDPRWKQALVAATAEAYEAGAPGVPFTVLRDGDQIERYWGQDRLDWVEQRIAAAAVMP